MHRFVSLTTLVHGTEHYIWLWYNIVAGVVEHCPKYQVRD